MIRPAKLIHENGRTSKCYYDDERMLLYTEAITCEFALMRGLRWKVDEDHPAQSEAASKIWRLAADETVKFFPSPG